MLSLPGFGLDREQLLRVQGHELAAIIGAIPVKPFSAKEKNIHGKTARHFAGQ